MAVAAVAVAEVVAEAEAAVAVAVVAVAAAVAVVVAVVAVAVAVAADLGSVEVIGQELERVPVDPARRPDLAADTAGRIEAGLVRLAHRRRQVRR